MEIRTELTGGAGRITPKPPQAKPDSTARSEIAFENAESLKRAMLRTPEVRADAVALGRQLIQQPGYPPPQIVNQLSEFLAGTRALEHE